MDFKVRLGQVNDLFGYIRSILPFSYVDGPGNRSVIFFQGCNMNCGYCHNPETIPICTQADEDVSKMDVDQIVEVLKPYLNFVSGVTVSGGECTVQAEFLLELVRALNKLKVDVLVDTNGSRPEVIEQIMPFISGVMLDIKSIDDEESKDLTGMKPAGVLRTFEMLIEADMLYEVRTVVHESLDSERTVKWVCGRLKQADSGARYKIIAFRPHGVKGDWEKYKQVGGSYLKELVATAKSYGVEVVLVD